MATDEEAVLKGLDFKPDMRCEHGASCTAPVAYLSHFSCCDESLTYCGLHKVKFDVRRAKQPIQVCPFCDAETYTLTHRVVGSL